MLTIYHYKSTRSVRVIWACEELSIPYHLEIIDPSVEYRSSDEWRALSPTGRIPAMADDGFTMFESGAMLQYVLDRYGKGRLVPEPGTADSAHYLQWSWFAEATCSRPIGDFISHALNTPEAERVPALVDESRAQVVTCLDAVEAALEGTDYLVANRFGAADIMMGYTLMVVQLVKLLGNDHPRTSAYLARLSEREGFKVASA